jgi:dihydropteroate synthase
MKWSTASGVLDLSVPLFLGILNVTPDSFSDGGQHLAPEQALDHAGALAAEGARMLDLGAESTRPGASSVDSLREWARLKPVLDGFQRSRNRLPLSLDTRHAFTARLGLRRGISVLNDVTGFADPEMLDLARNSTCGLIAMRSRIRDGVLEMPDYGGPGTRSATAALRELATVRDRLLQAGLAPERILLDPGFGFGTTFAEDLALWQSLPELPRLLDWPVERFCIGVSRKRFLAWKAGTPSLAAPERDALTKAAHLEAMKQGYRVFRTHQCDRLPPPDLQY